LARSRKSTCSVTCSLPPPQFGVCAERRSRSHIFPTVGWFFGLTHGLGLENFFLRKRRFALADEPLFCLNVAREFVAAKIRNQRTMLRRNHLEPPPIAAGSAQTLRVAGAQHGESRIVGDEENAARIYFANFAGMIKAADDGDKSTPFTFAFNSPCAPAAADRSRSTPRCPSPTACWPRTSRSFVIVWVSTLSSGSSVSPASAARRWR